MTNLKKQLSMWNNHQMYFWWASGIRLPPVNIYINDLEVNIKSLQKKIMNDRKMTGWEVLIRTQRSYKVI